MHCISGWLQHNHCSLNKPLKSVVSTQDFKSFLIALTILSISKPQLNHLRQLVYYPSAYIVKVKGI